MKIPFQLFFPSQEQLDALIISQDNSPITYIATQEGLSAYKHDNNKILLGEGDAIFAAAKQAIRQWAMFPGGWAKIYSDKTPLEVGRVVVICARVMGFWWLNTARIVHVVDKEDRFGFAYGTLTHHAESGEELFLVEMDEQGQVWYRIEAYSQPQHWLARYSYPLPRFYQKKFIRHSLRNMKKATLANLQIAEPEMVCWVRS